MTRQFPDPGDRFNVIEISDPRAPSGRVKVDIPEIKRRQSHIELIVPSHSLLPLALDCLKDRDTERPSCHKICSRIATLKSSLKYTADVQQSQVKIKPAQSDDQANREPEVQQSQQIRDLQQQLHTQSDQLRAQSDQLRTQSDQLHTQTDQLRTQSDQLQRQQHENQQQRMQLLEQQKLFITNEQFQTLQKRLTVKDEQLAATEKERTDREHQLQQKEIEIATHLQEILRLGELLQSVSR